jgi:hypothetical protein
MGFTEAKMILLKTLQFFLGLLRTVVVLVVITTLLFIIHRGTQPMSLPQVPDRMSYWQFMGDRLEAAKEVKPARCGIGMFSFLVLVGPFYSALYTYDSFLARVSQPDPSIPKEASGSAWYQVPEIWWKVVEKISWTALALSGPGCRFRPVKLG